MFLSAPGKTPYDLSFNFLGFPVRVHPAFFILPVLFSQGFMKLYSGSSGLGEQLELGTLNAGVVVFTIAAVFFVSVLVHELGHTIAFRYFGIDSHIVLYWMGGLAIPENGMGSWRGGRTRSLTPNEQIIVSLAGPVAGLLLAAVFILVAYLLTGSFLFWWSGPIPNFQYVASGVLGDLTVVDLFVRASIFINVILNLFNLLPVFPMDGGQIARQFFIKGDPHTGARKSVMLSLGISVFIALYAMSQGLSFLGFFFGFMAWNNYQQLMFQGGGRRPW